MLFKDEMKRIGITPTRIPFIEVAIYEGNYDDALEMATVEMKFQLERGALRYYLDILEQKARALLGLGQFSAAEDLLEEGITLAGKQSYMSLVWRLWDTRGKVRLGLGDKVGAQEAFSAAKAILQYLVVNLPDEKSKKIMLKSPLLTHLVG